MEEYDFGRIKAHKFTKEEFDRKLEKEGDFIKNASAIMELDGSYAVYFRKPYELLETAEEGARSVSALLAESAAPRFRKRI